MRLKQRLFIILFVLIFPFSAKGETVLDLQKELLQNNPEIVAARNRYFAAQHVPIQEGTLPDPVVSFTDLGVGHPFSRLNDSEFAYRGFGFSQDLPYPGKLSLRSKIAGVKAEALEKEVRLIALRLLSELRMASSEYLYTQQAMEITREQQKFVGQVSEIAQVKYGVGQGLQQDVLRSQVEQSLIAEKLELLEEDLGKAQASINALLNRDPSTSIQISDRLLPTPMNLTLEELEKKVKENSPELQSKTRAEEQQKLQLQLAHKDLYPDFTANFQWQKTGSNSSDYYMTSIEARIPLYFWRRQKPAIAEAELELKASQKDTEATARRLLADLQKQYVIATRTANLLKLYNEGIVPQTRASLESAFTAYQVGKIDFLSLLNNATTLLNYQNEYQRRLADHEIAIAQIQAITGMPLQTEAALLLGEEVKP
jgi:cobalt-zinc-cadmium efflux system outer membrane protein